MNIHLAKIARMKTDIKSFLVISPRETNLSSSFDMNVVIIPLQEDEDAPDNRSSRPNLRRFGVKTCDLGIVSALADAFLAGGTRGVRTCNVSSGDACGRGRPISGRAAQGQSGRRVLRYTRISHIRCSRRSKLGVNSPVHLSGRANPSREETRSLTLSEDRHQAERHQGSEQGHQGLFHS
jgi:hypothetical protein